MSKSTDSPRNRRIRFFCKFPRCGNAFYDGTENKKFHVFPKDPIMCERWRKACDFKESQKTFRIFICEDHFRDEDYLNSNRTLLNYKKAVPKNYKHPRTSNDTTQPNSNYVQEDFSGGVYVVSNIRPIFGISEPVTSLKMDVTPTVELDTNSTVLNDPPKIWSPFLKKDYELKFPEVREIHMSIVNKFAKLKSLVDDESFEFETIKNLYNEGTLSGIEQSLSNISSEYVDLKLANIRRPEERLWTVEEKVFASSIYKRSPRLYQYLQCYFQMPYITTVKQFLSDISFDCGIIKPILMHLKSEVEKMNNLEKYCSLLFNKIYFFENNKQSSECDYVIVFMIRGIKINYKQVIAYYFAEEIAKISLERIIRNLISNIFEIGLEVVATICDHTYDDMNASNFIVNEKRIHRIFDVPHLLKSIRNALLEYHIQFEKDKIAKFEYVNSVYELDSEKRIYKQLSKLRPYYFEFDEPFVKSNVKVAAQQLSQTVCAAIETFVHYGDIPGESIQTAEFIFLVDNLFDSLNSSNVCDENAKKLRCALTAKSEHHDFWAQISPKLREWRLLDIKSGDDVTEKYDFIQRWLTTIHSVQQIWRDLRKQGLQHLILRNLNQDPLENLFSQIQYIVRGTNFDRKKFVDALKIVLINNYAVSLNAERNCEDDHCVVLGDLSDILTDSSAY